MGYGLLRVMKNCGKLPYEYVHIAALILAQAKTSVKPTGLGGGEPQKPTLAGQLVD
jgi:hypothetical protein